MKVNKTLKHACRVLRHRVYYNNAELRLPGHEDNLNATEADTEAIQKAVQLYVDLWIEPIISAIEDGDMGHLSDLTRSSRGISFRQLWDERKKAAKKPLASSD